MPDLLSVPVTVTCDVVIPKVMTLHSTLNQEYEHQKRVYSGTW